LTTTRASFGHKEVAMGHQCEAAVISCIDFRLHKAVHEFLKAEGLEGQYDYITEPGVQLTLVRRHSDIRNFHNLTERIAKSQRLHDIKRIILIAHTDCGAYRDFLAKSQKLGVPEIRLLRHHLAVAVDELKAIFPNLPAECYIAYMQGDKVSAIKSVDEN
jgi:carbonic anhydrase